jgi:hypothetical protein
MMEAQEHRHLPSLDRISIVSAAVLLVFALVPFLGSSTSSLKFQIQGIVFEFPTNYASLISFVAAALAAAGTDWLLQSHPHRGNQSRLPHWVLPGLTAWAIGVPLSRLKVGGGWWIVFGLGNALLILVMVSEYISMDLADIRYMPSTLGLTAVAFALFLIVIVAVRGVGLRLYLMIIMIMPFTFLIALKTLFMRLEGKWCWVWSGVIALVVGQIAFGMHYAPLSPLRYGLILTGVAYAFTAIAGGVEERRLWSRLWIEPAVALAVFGLLAVLINA